MAFTSEETYKKELLRINRNKRLEKAKICVYCGAAAGTEDHPVPLTYFHTERKIAKMLFNNRGWKTLPSCSSCNNLAGYSWSESFVERKGRILERFEKKYKKEIKAKTWDDEEISSLSGMLQEAVKEALEWDSFIKLRHENLINPNPIYE